jgi:hypothetical protein
MQHATISSISKMIYKYSSSSLLRVEIKYFNNLNRNPIACYKEETRSNESTLSFFTLLL